MAFKLSANLSFLFKEKSFLERFDVAAACGFTAVEFGSEVPGEWTKEQLAEAQQRAGVEVVILSTPIGGPGEKGLAALPGREAEFKRILATSIDYAKALNCKMIHVLSGAFSEEVAEGSDLWKQAESTYVTNLRIAAEECAKHDISVLIEPISNKQHYFLQHQQQAVEIIKKADRSNIKIEFDTYHAQRMDGNLSDFLTQNLAFIGHIQVGQVPDRHEPDEDGEINFNFFFKTLAKIGYKGWVGCEYHPRGETKSGLGWASGYLKH